MPALQDGDADSMVISICAAGCSQSGLSLTFACAKHEKKRKQEDDDADDAGDKPVRLYSQFGCRNIARALLNDLARECVVFLHYHPPPAGRRQS